jgi:hypothetical protein
MGADYVLLLKLHIKFTPVWTTNPIVIEHIYDSFGRYTEYTEYYFDDPKYSKYEKDEYLIDRELFREKYPTTNIQLLDFDKKEKYRYCFYNNIEYERRDKKICITGEEIYDMVKQAIYTYCLNLMISDSNIYTKLRNYIDENPEKIQKHNITKHHNRFDDRHIEEDEIYKELPINCEKYCVDFYDTCIDVNQVNSLLEIGYR